VSEASGDGSARGGLVWWQWAVIAIAGLLIWQIVMNANAIAASGLSAAGLLETVRAWLPAFAALTALAIALVGFHILYLWPGEGLSGIGLTSRRFGADFALGAAAGIAQAALSLFVVIPALGDAASETLQSVKGLFESPERLVASVILVIVYGGIVEEIFFRGHVIRSVSRMLGNGAVAVAAAGVLSVALFAVAHRYQGEVGMLYAVGASCLYAALFLLTNRLTASMSAHAVYDAVTLVGIYVLYGDLLGLNGG